MDGLFILKFDAVQCIRGYVISGDKAKFQEREGNAN
jgi:hypothetical protein